MARFGAAVVAGAGVALGLPGSAGAAEWTLTTLYSFAGGSDGGEPDNGALIAGQDGTLYGTTSGAGGEDGRGTVFQLTPPANADGAWTEKVLLNFAGGHLGYNPQWGLVLTGGSLYGTTPDGGWDKGGMAFRLYPPAPSHADWRESVLYSFANNDAPYTTLLHGAGNVLYGTASSTNSTGSVFSFTPPAIAGGAWTQAYLHIFSKTGTEGYAPYGSLAADDTGALYGTTIEGGSAGYGTVYKLTPPPKASGTWTETILYSFQGGPSDGAVPVGGLVMDNAGVLYGTTQDGGINNNGAVFCLAPPAKAGGTWSYSVLHIFTGGKDGTNPSSGLTLSATGNLYGTTFSGGSADKGGSVFRLTPPATSGGAWSYSKLYGFDFAGDSGYEPAGSLLLLHGALYGTTYAGGKSGHGTVFKLTAPG